MITEQKSEDWSKFGNLDALFLIILNSEIDHNVEI